MSSDAEMATPPASKRRGGRSTPPKASGKKSKKDLTPEVAQEEEGDGDEEEYEIEKILDCQKGMFAPNRWAFYVSWKGYGSDDNSWVDEPDFFAKELMEKWWLDNPSIKGNPLAGKKAKGRKSEATSSSKVKSRKASTEEEEDPKSSSKRKSGTDSTSKKRASEEADVTPEIVSEDEQRPKKKSRTKKKEESPPPQNGFFDGAAEGSDLNEHVLDAMSQHMGKKSWEKLIKSIETVERQEDGVLLVYYSSTDGIRAISNSRILAEKAPQKLIAFYENHLRWRNS
ncbi:hypothetical protein M407DRAFT_240721 [Tulasnella calospora MUT 4182]|uniref:Chromo domain-containing protein n=1 Tax=Tulasnella calospora MUT 4182 TaxID=1051891 RepID=A0A0C3QWB2_9AGAM|nr:hypothetical protein M407DRAFT_240721 [Tulasnella calospora MUT 4182]